MDILGVSLPLWLILLVLTIYILYRWSTSSFDTFKKLGIDGPKPWPLFGTLWPLMKMGFCYHDVEMNNRYGKIVGVYNGRKPTLLVYDPDILKQIMVKGISNFTNRALEDFYMEPPLDKQLMMLRDDHWKHVRNHVTPAFTGKKLRQMVSQINTCAKTLVGNLKETMVSGDSFECKEYTWSFTMDVIASAAFGIDIDSKTDKDNQFVKMGRKSIIGDTTDPLIIIFFLAPKLGSLLCKYFKIDFVPSDCKKFFTDIVLRTIEDRQKNPAENPKDFLGVMLASRVDDLKPEEVEHPDALKDNRGMWSNNGLTQGEVVAQAFSFFSAGFDTVASSLALAMYNLALYPAAQDKVYQEILDVVGKQADPDYNQVKQLTYLQMCVDETLRLYPIGFRVDRAAADDIEIGGVKILKGMTVGIPVYAIHHNPKYWDNPEEFIPERFTPEAKANRHPCTYMPFGVGPRRCVAERFGLLQLKVALVHIMRAYKLVTSDKTQIPLKLCKMKMEGENGTWLKLLPRE